MRLLSFALLASAALDWPGLWLDRAGAAALGLAFLALTLPSRPRRRLRSPLTGATPAPPAILDDEGRLDPARLERIISASRLGGTGE